MPERPLREIFRAVATRTSPSLPGRMKVMLRCAGALVVAVAGKGKGGIGERKDEAAMGDALAVDHVRLDRHRQRRLARLDLDDLHAEAAAGLVTLPHRMGAGARDILRRQSGLYVH